MSDCPCGLALPYAQCCGAYVEDFAGRPAPGAEALMRSRYSAFVLGRGDYLQATWHASKRPSQIRFDAGVKWLGLDVRDVKEVDADHAEVEFVARQRDKSGRAVRLHERSRFVREDGRWYYVDGDWL
ncbi:MAG: YchJ family protein [Hylemonella sp.]|uniref:YchJ family protein n=1 Tax=Hylemonella sp. TaxID=2066020 RepID=UPI00391BB7DA